MPYLFPLLLTLALLGATHGTTAATPPLRLGHQLELFTDHPLIERLESGASLRLHTPERAGVALRFDRGGDVVRRTQAGFHAERVERVFLGLNVCAQLSQAAR